ncbi:MAG TPA: phosphoribosylformimino-5-aminoimidazole carboxamide ribotide isomerase [Limnochordia bacterium]|nr:phosphoribosylformimino-5-aminoimidazole carboxamide ribotide isomerase [Limnochordia bacterium]
MAFRPCIDLRGGRVVQIVGGTLNDTDAGATVSNFVAEQGPADYARLYRRDGLIGGHVIMLGPGNEAAAREALAAYPGGLQIGGGITPENAESFLAAGASHVIVTSYLFTGGELDFARLETLSRIVGPERLVVDLSCRLGADGAYRVATNRWQTVTRTVLSSDLFERLAPYCAEFLLHAVDVEGLQRGIDRELVVRLGEWLTRPGTYAGGAKALADIATVEALSGGKLDLTIGSALDIFGGHGVRYAEAAAFGRKA